MSSEAPPSAASANVPGSGTISTMENLWLVLVSRDSSWKFLFRLREFQAGHQGHVKNSEATIGLPDHSRPTSGTNADIIRVRHFNFMSVDRDDFKRLKRAAFKIFFYLFGCHEVIFVSLVRYCNKKKLHVSQTIAGGWAEAFDNFYVAMFGDVLRVGATRDPGTKRKTHRRTCGVDESQVGKFILAAFPASLFQRSHTGVPVNTSHRLVVGGDGSSVAGIISGEPACPLASGGVNIVGGNGGIIPLSTAS